MLGRAHEWLDRHPVIADVALALIVLAFSLSTMTSDRNDASATAIVATVLLIAPLAARRRAPVAVFAAVMVACGLELVLVDQFLAANVAALIALYTLVAYAPRRLAAIGFVISLAGAIPFTVRVDDFTSDSRPLTWLVLALHIALAAMLGDRRHAQLAQRARLAAVAAAEERARIARELHDIVAHSLSVVIAQADGGRYDPQSATTALTTIARTAREAQREMRRALGLLGEAQAPREPQPGPDELPALVERTRASGLDVALEQEGEPRPLAPAAGLAVYRVAQEALTNVLKHAGPGAKARVQLRWEPDRVTVVVKDDGAGSVPGDGPGRGLTGMRERVEPRGGTLDAGPRPEGGFEVRAAIPA
jgi:signal transduction histidine kinase